MERSLGVKVPARRAEEVRRRLLGERLLREDLRVRHEGHDVVFPVTAAPRDLQVGRFEFEARLARPRDYAELLPLEWRAAAPRAFDVMGDLVLVKVPADLWRQRHAIGDALLRFHGARAVFHDHGVTGEHRTRKLEPIAGTGSSQTVVAENGFRIHVDPARAYFSPRLADERRRIVALARPQERIIDLFGGVAPLGIQLARKGCEVVSIDINPAAVELARQNAATNRVELELLEGDARELAGHLAPAHRVVMNLPHAAKDFLPEAAPLVLPGGTLHHHEIMAKDEVEQRRERLVEELHRSGRAAIVDNVRHVRDYSAAEAHFAFDVRLE